MQIGAVRRGQENQQHIGPATVILTEILAAGKHENGSVIRFPGWYGFTVSVHGSRSQPGKRLKLINSSSIPGRAGKTGTFKIDDKSPECAILPHAEFVVVATIAFRCIGDGGKRCSEAAGQGDKKRLIYPWASGNGGGVPSRQCTLTPLPAWCRDGRCPRCRYSASNQTSTSGLLKSASSCKRSSSPYHTHYQRSKMERTEKKNRCRFRLLTAF